MEDGVRPPIAAGTFYPAGREALVASVTGLLGEDLERRCAPLDAPCGLIVPHAGYPYSGPTAACGYRSILERGRPTSVILLGANHTGLGGVVSLDDHSSWRTPLGDVPVDRDLARRLEQGGLSVDRAAFEREHSIEVQLPFLQTLWGSELPIVPVCVQPAPHDLLTAVAAVLAEGVEDRQSVLLIASSDFTHYQADAVARELDRTAIEPILALNADRFLRLCSTKRLSICGAGAIAVLIEVSSRLGMASTHLVDYSTSGDTSGDRSAVVGYAAVSFFGREHGS
jgi:AmmeMemoRadiSam system protein B